MNFLAAKVRVLEGKLAGCMNRLEEVASILAAAVCTGERGEEGQVEFAGEALSVDEGGEQGEEGNVESNVESAGEASPVDEGNVELAGEAISGEDAEPVDPEADRAAGGGRAPSPEAAHVAQVEKGGGKGQQKVVEFGGRAFPGEDAVPVAPVADRAAGGYRAEAAHVAREGRDGGDGQQKVVEVGEYDRSSGESLAAWPRLGLRQVQWVDLGAEDISSGGEVQGCSDEASCRATRGREGHFAAAPACVSSGGWGSRQRRAGTQAGSVRWTGRCKQRAQGCEEQPDGQCCSAVQFDEIEDCMRPSKVHRMVEALRDLVCCTRARVADDDWETWEELQWLAQQFEEDVVFRLGAEGNCEWVMPRIEALAIFITGHGLMEP